MKSPALNIEPWLPPREPDLARLAMAAADAAGIQVLRSWPELRKGGIGFQELPPFLSWQGLEGGRRHLVLLQPREVGALVPGARSAPLPERWLERLDLDSLTRPLACHPDFPGGAAVHVVHLAGAGRAQVRSAGEPGPGVVRAVLERLTGVGAEAWEF
ncbi:MAG: hypothetical protein P4L36_12960 [Holophaga sp.]|nr:hypothetical protein [Holophaga sp.]